MYLTEEKQMLDNNGIILISWQEGTVSLLGGDGSGYSYQDYPAVYALGWDPITKEYKCYAKTEDIQTPNMFSSYDDDVASGMKALMYGNKVDIERAKELFKEVDFVEDFLESDGGIRNRMPEFFI